MNKRLYRSRTNKMLAGVCGGLGEYMQINPTIVRIVFVMLFLQGMGGLIYLVLWFILPYQDEPDSPEQKVYGSSGFASRASAMGQDLQQSLSRPNPDFIKYIGIGLIASGVFLVLERLDIRWLGWFNSSVLWSLLLIAGGAILLYRSFHN
jgi:phage shock protein C